MVEIGQVISSKYKLLRLLGDGGMGSVYEAEHLRLGTRVAIKVLHSDLARRAGLIDRFLQEARVSAQIRSPHVVQVTDVESTDDGIAYLVMELLQGEPLSNVEKRDRRLPTQTACEYTLQILSALEAAHSLGVVHRDLKPDNVFVTFDGGKPVIKLIDFGIAKLKRAEAAPGQKNLTVAGMMMGTPEYMAPEQAYSATDVDARADLYSVGVMLYEMLSGQTPAQGDDPRVVVLKVERGEVTPLVHVAPGVPPEIAGLVHRAMAPRPELRFSSAAEMRLALEAVLAGKRPGTAKIQASVVAAASAVMAPMNGNGAVLQQQPGPPQVAPPPKAIGTGTVMGQPAVEALSPNNGHGSGPPPPYQDPNLQRPGTGTARAGPIDQVALAHAQQQYAPQITPAPPRTGGPQKKGGAGLIIALAVVALLLGAGAVVTYVMSTSSSNPIPPDPIPTITTLTPTQTTPTAVVPTTPTTPNTPAQPLNPPVPPQPGPQPKPPQPHPSGSPSTHPSGSAAPSTAPTSPFPPFPSGIPPFPSSIPIPSGFPTFQVPSGFPPLFPPQQAPAPAQ